jgi:hypothetical protein
LVLGSWPAPRCSRRRPYSFDEPDEHSLNLFQVVRRRLIVSVFDVPRFVRDPKLELELGSGSQGHLEKSREVFRAATCTSLDNITSDGHGGATHLLGESEALFDGKGSS